MSNMNLRAKKENMNPENILKDKTNIRTTRGSIEKRQKICINKENQSGGQTKTTKARKPKSGLKIKKSLPSSENKLIAKDAESPHSPYCFGFSDDDVDGETPHYDTSLTAFDNNRPYRLALYVRPSRNMRVNKDLVQKIQNWSTMNLANSTLNPVTKPCNKNPIPRKRILSDTIMSPDRTEWKVPFCSTPKETSHIRNNANLKVGPNRSQINLKSMIQKKITDLLPPSPRRTRGGNLEHNYTSFFEKSPTTSSEEDKPIVQVGRKKATASKLGGQKMLRKKDISNIAKKSDVANAYGTSSDEEKIQEPPIHFQKPSRRSYVKKFIPEAEDQTPTETVLKSIKQSKEVTKSKKDKLEEEEFEKWSRTMNSEFSEVEQFEISIG